MKRSIDMASVVSTGNNIKLYKIDSYYSYWYDAKNQIIYHHLSHLQLLQKNEEDECELSRYDKDDDDEDDDEHNDEHNNSIENDVYESEEHLDTRKTHKIYKVSKKVQKPQHQHQSLSEDDIKAIIAEKKEHNLQKYLTKKRNTKGANKRKSKKFAYHFSV